MAPITNEDSLSILETYRYSVGPLPNTDHASPVPGTQKAGHSPVYRNNATKDGSLRWHLHPRLDNMDSLLRHTVNLHGQENALGYRSWDAKSKTFAPRYEYIKFDEMLSLTDTLASGIVHAVLTNKNYIRTPDNSKDGKPSFVLSIYAENRYEWVLTDSAAMSVSLPSTALYDTLGRDSVQYCLELTESPIVFVTAAKIDNVLVLKEQGSLKDMCVMVCYDSVDRKTRKRANRAGITLMAFQELLKSGTKNPLPAAYNPPNPDTVFTICFTSGTTGMPKGAVLTHRSMVASTFSSRCQLEDHSSVYNKNHFDMKNTRDDIGGQYRALCTLPLAHVYERCTVWCVLTRVMTCGFLSKGMPSLVEDLRLFQPTFFSSVPRVWNKIAMGAKALLTQYDLNTKKHVSEVDKLLVRNKLRKYFGFDNIRTAASGGAPLSGETTKFLCDWFCMGFSQGYGATETASGVASVNPLLPGAVLSSCGPVFVSVEARLRDVPELGYHHTDKPHPRGELLLRGPQMFTGYYKQPGLTSDALDEDGFFRTGDVASFDEEGNLSIIDRVKNFFKLAQGEYVAAEKIENVYTAHSPIVQQIFVHGDSDRNFLVGIIGIDPDVFAYFLKSQGINVTHEQMVAMLIQPKIRAQVVHAINSHISNAGLQGFEKLHNVHLDIEPLTLEDDTLTPTLKVKRTVARKKFGAHLERMYKEGSLYKPSKL